jgi:DNA-directed RNA polymerase sigma subunit (sigma70/sigma32)
LRVHFGLGPLPTQSLTDIGVSSGLTQERIRQSEEAAAARLRHALRRERLRPLLET